MTVLRPMSLVLIAGVYIAGAALIGTLLASKTASPTSINPEQRARYDAMRAFESRYNVRASYQADSHIDVLAGGPAEVKVSTAQELLERVATPACVVRRIPYSGNTTDEPETIPFHNCLSTAAQLEDFDPELPQPYIVSLMCSPLVSLARPDASNLYFQFHDPLACLDASAAALKWKGYYDLKQACRMDAERDAPRYPGDRGANLAARCVLQNVMQWTHRERDICRNMRVFSPGKCR